MKKFFGKCLVLGVFGLLVFWPFVSLAIKAPSGLTPCSGVQPLAVLLDWDDQPNVDHYELYYKKVNETNWTDRYPSISQYQVAGLSPAKDYQWYVVSCGDPDCANSAASSFCFFTTQELQAPPGNGGNGGGPIGLDNPLMADTLEEAINAFVNFLFYLAMVVAPILIIYAGFLLLTAAGDPVKVSKGRQVITWTMVALVIILFAKGLPALIRGAFGG